MSALLVLTSVLLASAAEAAPTVAWRVDLGGPAASHPAVSASGHIAISTATGVLVLDGDGKVLRRLEAVPCQPMWDGDALWVRTEAGWVRHRGDEVSQACGSTTSAILSPDGALLFASDRALESCGDERKVLVERQGRAGHVFALAGGYATADEWWLELFDAAFAPVARVRVDEVGFPVGVDPAGRLLVTAPNGRLRAVDLAGIVIWQGPAGDDGPPLATTSGLVVLGGRALSLIDGEQTVWSLPVAAGVRQAALLEDDTVAILERSGRLGLVQGGRPVWAKRLHEPGQLFGLHPSGLLLVQEGRHLVAWRSPGPDAKATIPIARGLDRSGRWPGGAKEPSPTADAPDAGPR